MHDSQEDDQLEAADVVDAVLNRIGAASMARSLEGEHPMKQIACKLCGLPFVCDNGMWSTTCTCAKDKPVELAAAHGEPLPVNEPEINEREERAYRLRRERFALAIYREMVRREEGSKLFDWKPLAQQAVEAADALDEALYPSPGPILPEYIA